MIDRFVRTALLALAVAFVGCQSTSPSAEPASATEAPTPSGLDIASTPPMASEAAAPSPASEATLDPDIPPGVVVGPGEYVLDDPAIGLAGLADHRSTLTVSFDGTVDGAPRAWSTVTTLITVRDPYGATLLVEHTGDIEPPVTPWRAVLGGVAYQLAPDGSCTADLDAVTATGLPELAAELSGLLGADAAGREHLDGIEVDRYTFDGRALGLSDPAAATGSVLIGPADGHVVRYEATTHGDAALFGEGVTGTHTVRYELEEPGTAVSLDLPSNCPPGLLDAPLPPDAAGVVRLPGLTRFTSPLSLKRIVAFYGGAAKGAGWRSTDPVAQDGRVAILEYASGPYQVEVIAERIDGGVRCAIVASSR